MNTKSIAQRSNATNNAHLLLAPFLILVFLYKECILDSPGHWHAVNTMVSNFEFLPMLLFSIATSAK